MYTFIVLENIYKLTKFNDCIKIYPHSANKIIDNFYQDASPSCNQVVIQLLNIN